MREMVYGEKRAIELLSIGEYKGYLYVIVSYGSHPCAYVRVPDAHPLYERGQEEVDFVLDVHGGVTYKENGLWRTNSALDFKDDYYSCWIGWDYAHGGDYVPYLHNDQGHKWTTYEIFNEVKQAIDRLRELE